MARLLTYITSLFQVKVSFYKNAEEVAYVVFNNTPVTYNTSDGMANKTVTYATSWFDCNMTVDGKAVNIHYITLSG